MRTISQRELRNDNAAIMRAVEMGESFLVTKYGRPMARLEPVTEPDIPVAAEATVQGGFSDLPRVLLDISTEEVLDDLRGDR